MRPVLPAALAATRFLRACSKPARAPINASAPERLAGGAAPESPGGARSPLLGVVSGDLPSPGGIGRAAYASVAAPTMAPSAEVGPSSQLGGASEALQVARALSAGAADLIRAVLDPDTGPPEQRPLREAILDLSLKERLGPPGAGSPAARAIAAQLTQLSDAQVAQLGAVRAYVATRNLSAPDQAEFAPLRTRLARLFFDGVSLRARDRGTAPRDRTDEFDKVIARLRGVGAPLEIPRTDHPVLIIPGVNTREQRAVPGVTPGYMDRNQAALEQIQGAEHVVRSSISTHDSVEGNAEKLSQEILKLAAGFKQRVILFTHSKGGADAAWVLTRPEVQQSTLAVISMNAAYGGTPLATLFAKSGLGAVAQALQPESDGRGVPSLDFDVSQARDEETALEVPIIQLAAAIATGGSERSFLMPTAEWMAHDFAQPSDGFVPLADQYIPGKNAHAVTLVGPGRGLDHIMPAGQTPPGSENPPFTAEEVTQALWVLMHQIVADQIRVRNASSS